jgi:ribonucleoside-diphosphate reductase alpha chain
MSGNSKLTENALAVAISRYFMEGETWEDCAKRVGTEVGRVENGNAPKYIEEFSEMIYNMDFLPGGRILRNTRRARGSLFNCYVLPLGDSIEEIGQFVKDSLILWSEGGGVGVNYSSLRPRGASIKGKGGNSSGPVSFLEASDAVAKTIESGGSRRAAAMGLMHVSHPDIFEFIDVKLTHDKLKHYNLSVAVDDDFLEAVEADKDWHFKFAQQDYGKIKAKDIWNKIINNMVSSAEPGLLNWGNLTSNNSYYFDPILSTNPCGEVPLGSYGVCNLGSIVLPNFIRGSVTTNWKKLEYVLRLAVRFLDNVIEINKYVLKEIDINAHNGRRIGIGMMGLAEYLFAKKLRYGSKEAILDIERLMRFIRDTVYDESIQLSVEKGAFPKFDPVQYGKSHFIRTLPASVRMSIKKSGIRNVTLMAMAPTGTISLIPEATSGIEPLPYKAYKRADRVSDRIYVHPMYKPMLDGELGEGAKEWYVDTTDLSATDHFETQSIIQKYVDGALSKTINLQKGTTAEELSDITLEYIYDLKGVTVYVDGSRENQPVTAASEKEVKDYLKNKKELIDDTPTEIDCAVGGCEV